ncbi:acyl-CoA dehydrogenase family protein [Candidatus Poriferisodalis sp.]|uniref:acyl-CoA dehydrogenase family protein n=1 Tax=Candidatus Poriferisodalis sp. TaxID=3101277 RepID=UPI003B02B7C0
MNTAVPMQSAATSAASASAVAADAAIEANLESFRTEAAAFLAHAVRTGIACPAYGAILAPELHEQARLWQRHCFEGGWAGLHWPAEHGGQSLSRRHTAVWMEECERAGVAPYLNLQGIVLAGEAILRAGTADQQRTFLRPTLTGELLWCQLFSEPGAGSDLGGLAAAAVADDDRFVLNGQKVWSSNAQFAEYGILMARTEPDAPKHRGISFFLLDMSLPGVEVRPIRQMTGDSEFCEVYFDDVAVPADALLGGRGGGWGVAMAVLEDERGGAGAAGVTGLRKRLAQMVEAAGATGPHGRQSLADLFARGSALAALMDLRGTDARMAPVAKLANSELGYDEAAVAVGLRGAHALVDSAPTQRFLYAPCMRIAGGTSEIQRNIIGERVLGLPREPSP